MISVLEKHHDVTTPYLYSAISLIFEVKALCLKMSAAKISTRDGPNTTIEDFTVYSGVRNAPKLRHQTTEEGVELNYDRSWQDSNDMKTNGGSFGTVRTFSSSGKQRFPAQSGKRGLYSFFNGSTEPNIRSDLSTKHVDYDNDKGKIENYVWSRIPGSQHFVISDNLKFILNCCMWYTSSSLTNNIGKSIMNAFRFPVTLTFIQFGLVAFWCYLVSAILKTTHIRTPTHEILKTITPLAVFLIVGHVFSSVAISRVPVSLVHTIKALAPLFTVLFYRVIFQVQYTHRVYVSLLPLTLGVILACSFTYSNNIVGLSCALGSCFVFVTQNIFSKKLLFKESKLGDRNPNKLDKLNVLFYSSSLSFLLMIPLWLYYDGSGLLSSTTTDIQEEEGDTMSTTRLIIYFLLNGTMNFSQNWFAFTTLSLTSPVTYSILSLLKRIFVIVMSIVWFGQQISLSQGMGILLTFIGLWMYQQAKSDVDKGEDRIREKSIDLLPMQQPQWIPGAINNSIKTL
ncbi:unnamed protein product [Mucor hiemalis]